jgi:type I restriction enzyme M protein
MPTGVSPSDHHSMHWIAPSEKATNGTLEKHLWAAADQLRANSGLTSQQCSLPVLGRIFLLFAKIRFPKRRAELEKQAETARSSRRRLGAGGRVDDPTAYHAEGVLFLPKSARFEQLLALPQGAGLGESVKAAMAEQIHTLQRQIQNLRPTRDLLLPRLLSGQTNVQ